LVATAAVAEETGEEAGEEEKWENKGKEKAKAAETCRIRLRLAAAPRFVCREPPRR